jgi:hypothetical protein
VDIHNPPPFLKIKTKNQLFMTATAPLRYETAINPESSPYSLQSDPSVKVIDNFEMLPVTDTIIEDGITKQIRYVSSQHSIYVEDQLKNGLPADYGKSSTGNARKSKADIIQLVKGQIEVQPNKKNLIEYLNKCNYNGSNPNRNPESTILFYFDDRDVKAKKQFDKTKLIDKARGMIIELEGNYTKLQDVAKVLRLDTGMSEEGLLLALRKQAETTPELIINTLAEEKASVDLIVHKALEYGIIEFDASGTKYKYVGVEEGTIKGFQGRKSPDVAFKLLVKYLGSEEGNSDLRNIQRQIEAKNN